MEHLNYKLIYLVPLWPSFIVPLNIQQAWQHQLLNLRPIGVTSNLLSKFSSKSHARRHGLQKHSCHNRHVSFEWRNYYFITTDPPRTESRVKSLEVYEVSHWNLNMVVHQKIFNMNYSLGRQSHNSSSNVTFCISQGLSIFDWVAWGMWDYWYPFFFFFFFFLLVYCMLGN